MALKLYKEDGETIPAYQYVDDGAPPSGYTETDDPIDWDAAHLSIVSNPNIIYYSVLRNKIDLAYQALGAPTTPQKEIASKWFVVDESVRDTVHTQAQQDENANWLSKLIHLNRETVDKAACVSKIVDADKSDIDVVLKGHGKIWFEELTTTQRLALSPDEGYRVWDIDLNVMFVWSGTVWQQYSGWRTPNPLTLADFKWAGGAIIEANTGAGYHVELPAGSSAWGSVNVALDGMGALYDGSDLAVDVCWGVKTTTPVTGDNVKFNVQHALVKADGTQDGSTVQDGDVPTTIDVFSPLRTADRVYVDTLNTMSGVAGAKFLEFNFQRISSGGGADTYPGTVEIFAIDIARV